MEEINVRNIDVYNWNLNGSYSFSDNDFDANTLYETTLDLIAGDKLVLLGFVSGYLDGDNDKTNSHLLCRFKINDNQVADAGAINTNANYISASINFYYTATQDESLNIKFQIRGVNYNTNGSCITIDSSYGDGWSGSRVQILHIKGA